MFRINATHSPLPQAVLAKATPTKSFTNSGNATIIIYSQRQSSIQHFNQSNINSIKLYRKIISVLPSIIIPRFKSYRPISTFDTTNESKKLDSSFDIKNKSSSPFKLCNPINNPRALSPMDQKAIDQGAISPQLLNKINIAQKQNDDIQRAFQKESPSNQSCINHTAKKVYFQNLIKYKAKYQVQNDSKITLCSKCAISMVGKGFKVQELQDNDIRQTQIKQFLQTINQLLPKFEIAISQLNLKKEDILNYHESQKSKLNAFFSSINECINSIRQKLEKTLENNYTSIIHVYTTSFNDLNKALNETISMKKDIEQNFERIIQQIENQPFLEIMACYNENLSSFLGQMDHLSRKPLEIVKINLGEQLFKVCPENISNAISLIKTSLLKRAQKENISGDSVFISFESKDQQCNSHLIKQNLNESAVEQKGNSTSQPFRSLFNDKQVQERKEEVLEEGASRVIEREDIENSYNLMLGQNDSETEEQVNQSKNKSHSKQHEPTTKQNGQNLFCSPQFKDN